MSRKELYKTSTWRRVRKSILLRQGGICSRCDKPAYFVHHKQHLTDNNYTDVNISINEDNLEALCKECHNKEHNPASAKQDYIEFDVNGDIIYKGE